MARKTKNTVQEPVQQAELTQIQTDMEQPEYGTHYRSRCGGALRTARENQGLSIQDIGTKLRLSANQIEAIEADNFAILPEPTIVRGFIRNYAKQLKINAEPLLDAYSVIVPSAEPHELIVKPTANMKMTSHDKPKAGTYGWAGLAVLVGLGAWIFYQNYIEKPSPTTPIASADSVEPLPEPALPAAERQSTLQATTELTLPPADASVTPPPVADVTGAAPASTPTQPIAAPLPPPVPPVEPPTTPLPNGMAKLEFNATQETWVNVVDANGRQVYSNTIFAGSRENINVTPPVKVTVGNAGATSLSMNGKVIDLAPHSRNNVAHIKLD
jgi:cytoskeleton protein RodZ